MNGHILAATLTIAFEGLMMFQGDNGGEQHVVVVDARDHYHKNPAVDVCDETACTRELLEPGDIVRFDGAPGKLKTNHRFRKYVPELRRFIKKGKIDDDVQKPYPAGNVLALVPLPAGGLTSWSAFNEQAKLETSSGRKIRRCFSRFTVLQTAIPLPSYVTIERHGKSIRLNVEPHQIVIISNISQQPRVVHFSAYEKLLEDGGQLGHVDVLYDKNCNTNVGKGQLGQAIETILAKHVPTPNGDCGQVRNPGGS